MRIRKRDRDAPPNVRVSLFTEAIALHENAYRVEVDEFNLSSVEGGQTYMVHLFIRSCLMNGTEVEEIVKTAHLWFDYGSNPLLRVGTIGSGEFRDTVLDIRLNIAAVHSASILEMLRREEQASIALYGERSADGKTLWVSSLEVERPNNEPTWVNAAAYAAYKGNS